MPMPARRTLLAALLALAALAALPCPAVAQEMAATANATNATEWVMPPEVEALFPKDAVFKEEIWHIYTHPLQNPTEQHKIKFARGTYEGVCHDYEININLWGGKYVFGASWTPIHSAHPHNDRFCAVEWEKLDPRNYVNIIRNIHGREWERTNTEFSKQNPNYRWKEISPIIKRILFGQNDGVYFYLERASLDIASDGKQKIVYRYAFSPLRTRLGIDGKLLPSWSYYFEDNSEFIKYHDMLFDGGELFYYMNTLYLIGEFGMDIQNIFKRNGKIGISTHCVFGIAN